MKYRLTQNQIRIALDNLLVDVVYHPKEENLDRLLDVINHTGRLGYFKMAREYNSIYQELKRDFDNYNELRGEIK